MKSSAGALMAALALVWMMWAPRPAWGQWTGGPTGPIYYNGGNVGIGTTNANAKLSFGQQVGIPLLYYFDEGAGVRYGTGIQGNELQTFVPTAAHFSVNSGGDLNNSGTNEIIRINGNGNVGIGTTNPQYRLSVNGQIGAKEVIVTNTGWSDYVFRPGYRLRPLSEVSAYIQANHHLPDIPSAAEVQEKGVGIGDMQAKLLAKIEELTLHMIQQEKENRNLRERIARLEAHAAGAPSGPSAPATGQ